MHRHPLSELVLGVFLLIVAGAALLLGLYLLVIAVLTTRLLAGAHVGTIITAD